MAVKPIPDGYQIVTPYLTVSGAGEFLEFMKKAFDAKERTVGRRPDGSISHAEMVIGDCAVMIADASEQWPAMPGAVHLYVEDCDSTYKKAVQAGATSLQEPDDQFYGDRMSGVRDEFGNVWWIATHIEDVSQEEMAKRAEAAGQSGGGAG